jgi:hypothetical protein
MTDSTANKPDGIFATVDLAIRLAKFLVDNHPAELFLTEQQAQHPAIFDFALQKALMDCGQAFTSNDQRLKRFAVQDQKLIQRCLEIHRGITASASYYSPEKYAERSVEGLVQDLTLWNNKDKPRTEVLARLERNPDFVNDLFRGQIALLEQKSTLRSWFNPMIGDTSDECLKIVSIIAKNVEHLTSAQDQLPPFSETSDQSLKIVSIIAKSVEHITLLQNLLPPFSEILGHPSSDKVAKTILSYLNHFDDTKGQLNLTDIGIKPISRALMLDLGAKFSDKPVVQAIVRYASRNADWLYGMYVLVPPIGSKLSFLDSIQKLLNESLQRMMDRNSEKDDLVDLIVAMTFLTNPKFKYSVSNSSGLVDKILSNQLVSKHVLVDLIEQYRQQGQCSDIDLVSAAGDELFKYSVISPFVSLQYFVDHSKDKTISEQILGQDLGL